MSSPNIRISQLAALEMSLWRAKFQHYMLLLCMAVTTILGACVHHHHHKQYSPYGLLDCHGPLVASLSQQCWFGGSRNIESECGIVCSQVHVRAEEKKCLTAALAVT